MRTLPSLSLALLAVAAMSTTALAQGAPQGPLPGATACPESVAALATCYAAKLETGAYVLAAMPKTWNGNLIVFAHGGPSLAPPAAADNAGSLTRYTVEIQKGFAWIASTYRREGYGVAMAAADTDDARKYFIEHIAKPKRTILHGTSYGGLVGTKVIESYAKAPDGGINYDGALLMSGAVAGPKLNYEFRADLRAVYQYYCKNLPRPEEASYPLWMGIPANSKLTQNELTAAVDECTAISKPANARGETQKQNLSNILNVAGIPERMLLIHLRYATFMFRNLAELTTHGKSAFSNMGVRYHGSTDDAALNRDVARFDADASAVAAVKADGEPAGVLAIPAVSLHSINDPQVAVESQYEYRQRVKVAGNGDRLVQAYTDEDQHAAQSPPEIAAALDQLMQWVEKGAKPTPQSIAAACTAVRGSFAGPCRFHPEYEPKPYSTRYARAGAAP